jgi:gliding motility-associated-like protein
MKYTLLFLIIIPFMACHDSITTIKGCCDEPALHATVGNGTIYVQNVFTPNGDGVNDQLIIYGDSIRQIISLKIKNRDGVTVFENRNLPANDYNTAWDGEFAGSIEQGLYTFTLKAEAENRIVATLKGKVCICPCDPLTTEDFVPMTGCEFGICLPEWIDCESQEHLPCFAN